MQDLNIQEDLIPKVEYLKRLFQNKIVIVAFSGGVDSTVLAHLAQKFSKKTIGIFFQFPFTSPSDLSDSKLLASKLGLELVTIEGKELNDPNFILNSSNRCYFCKKALGTELIRFSQKIVDTNKIIVEGTNASEIQGHRPGKKALQELGIQSPLADAKLTKSEIRQLARDFGLPNSEKPSMACLASRIAYGIKITQERLTRIAKAEEFLSQKGFQIVRVRDHGNIARIEVGKDEKMLFFSLDMFDQVSKYLKQLGFTYICLDLEGYRTGAMNEG
ncbi:MAG: ATP-dependent sacrificial sulfur transferase LarE [Promethearchaeota archaeon]